jgi:uncharacterized protein YjbJ (UPF0337 family)
MSLPPRFRLAYRIAGVAAACRFAVRFSFPGQVTLGVRSLTDPPYSPIAHWLLALVGRWAASRGRASEPPRKMPFKQDGSHGVHHVARMVARVFERARGGKPLGADELVSSPADVSRTNPPGTEPMSASSPNQREVSMGDHKSGPQEAVKGVVEGVKGKVKEVGGTVAGRDDLVKEGQAQQDKADAQRSAGKKEAEAEAARAGAKAAEGRQKKNQ